MSFSYTVGSRRSSETTQIRNPSNTVIKQPTTQQISSLRRSTRISHHSLEKASGSRLQHRNKSTNTACKTTVQTEPRIVTLSDLKIRESTKPPRGGKLKPINHQVQSKLKLEKGIPSSSSSNLLSSGTCGSRAHKKTTAGESNYFQATNNSSNSSNMSSSRNCSDRTHRIPPGSTGRAVGAPSHREMPPQPATSAPGQQQPRSGEAEYNPHGNYTLIHPNQAKRSKMQSQAAKEEAAYKKYKEQKRIGHVAITPRAVGGGGTSQYEARLQQQKKQQDKKYEMIQKREQWAREKKEREEQEFAEKKEQARRQTEINKRKQMDEEERRKRTMKNDHQRANEAFLRRYENKQRTMVQDYYS